MFAFTLGVVTLLNMYITCVIGNGILNHRYQHNSENLQFRPVTDFYPTCVEISDLYPPPFSILEPREFGSSTVYTLLITFSKPVVINGGRGSFLLAPLLTSSEGAIYAYQYIRWGGSERKWMVYFPFHLNSLAQP